MRLAASTWRVWQAAGRITEGREWLTRLLDPPGPDPSVRADALVALAGLDYWQHVEVAHWNNLEQLLDSVDEYCLKFFTTKTTRVYTDAVYRPGDFLIFGKETKGLPKEVRSNYQELCYTLPMENENIRSLNLAMTAGIVLYEAIRQQNHQ